jgi:hypothetical protein
MTKIPATSEQALTALRAAEFTEGEIHELIGRLSILAPDTLIEAIRRTRTDRPWRP